MARTIPLLLFPRCHRILKVYEGSKVVHFSLKAVAARHREFSLLVDASVAACIVCRIFFWLAIRSRQVPPTK